MSPDVRLFGRTAITIGEDSVEPPADLRHALLLYLAYTGAWTPRDDLLYLFWPDSDETRARSSLRQLLHTVRGFSFTADLEVERARVRWPVRTDAAEWRRALAERSLPPVDRWPQGTLLEGFRLPQAPEFESWLELERASLQDQARTLVLERAERCGREGRHEQALAVLDAWLLRAPLDEEALRVAMTTCERLGERSAALARFAAFEGNLRRDLGMEPTHETQTLAERLRTDQQLPPDRPTVAGMGAPLYRFTAAPGAAPLFGREAELTRLQELLTAGDRPVVTVQAIGGMGKTRLAVEAVGLLDGRFPDGSASAFLASVQDQDGLASALLGALGILPTPAKPLLEQIAAHLAERRMLILLDNLEHLPGAAHVVERLRAAAPGVAWLLTSRERVGVPHETVLPLGGLSYPAPGGASAPQEHGAVALLIHAARRSGVELDPVADGERLAETCRLVEGLPLAVELAAGWLRLLPLAELAQELRQGIDLLERVDGDSEARHASMRVVFDSSWRMLPEAERAALIALSVVQGGCQEDAARFIANVGRPLLLALRNRSLLTMDPQGRITLHPLLSAYVAERAERAPDHVEVARERHARWYLDHLATWEDRGQAGEEAEADHALAREHANIEAAWAYAIRAGEADPSWWQRLLKGGAHLGISYLAVGRYGRWTELLRQALTRLPQDSVPWAVLEAHHASVAADYAGRPDEGYARKTQAVQVLRRHDDRFSLAWGLLLLANSAHALGREAEEEALRMEAIEHFHAVNDPHLAGMLLVSLLNLSKDPETFEKRYLECEASYLRTGNLGIVAEARRDYAAFLANTYGEYQRAIDIAEEVRRSAVNLGVGPAPASGSLFLCAWLQQLVGDLATARTRAQEAFAEWTATPGAFPDGDSVITALFARIEELSGNAAEAKRLVAAGSDAGATPLGIEVRGRIALAEGNLSEARACADRALQMAATAREVRAGEWRRLRAQLLHAEVASGEGHDGLARQILATAFRDAERLHALPDMLEATALAARLLPPAQGEGTLKFVASHPATSFRVRRGLPFAVEMRAAAVEREVAWRETLSQAARVRSALTTA